MTWNAVTPPVPTTATRYKATLEVYSGGPLGYVADASLSMGIPIQIPASAVLAVGWSPDWGDRLIVDDATAFASKGAVRLTVDGESYWYTYESHDDTTFWSLQPVLRKKSPYTTTRRGLAFFDPGTVVDQWFDMSTYVDDWTIECHEGDNESYWTASLSGTNWNSLRISQDGAVLMIITVWDDILGTHDPIVAFSGFFAEPQPSGVPSKNTWTCSAEGRRKYLLLTPDNPRQYGGELVNGTWTASEALGDVAAEPMEGDSPVNFAIGNAENDDAGDLYISKDTPTVTLLTDGPTGGIELDNRGKPFRMLDDSGQGLRFTQFYFNPQPNGAHSAQMQKFFVLYNNTQVDPPDKGADTVSALEWGKYDITQYSLWTQNKRDARPLILYLGSKNGGPAPSITIGPRQGCVFVYDEPTFRSQFSLPPGWQVYELKQCAGELFGQDPNESSRGMGLAWDPDPDGCWIALKTGARAGNYQDFAAFSILVDADGGSTVTVKENGWTDQQVTDFLATWPTIGYLRNESNNRLVAYRGINAAARQFTSVTQVKGNPDFPVGTRIDLYEHAGYWIDFAAMGDIISKIPTVFPVKRVSSVSNWENPGDPSRGPSSEEGDGVMVNQNTQGVGDHVWGIWDNGGATPIVYDTTGNGDYIAWWPPGSAGWNGAAANRKVLPACPSMAALRRVVMGGGQFKQKVSSPRFYDHDSNSAADWATQIGVRIGNISELDSYIWLQFQPEEVTRAVVVEDNSDVGDADGTLTVRDGQARLYPGTCFKPTIWYMRALNPGGGAVDFLYGGRGPSGFEQVVKREGFAGVTIAPGATLVTMVNTKAAWNQRGANVFAQVNMPRAIGLAWERWKPEPPDVQILAVGADTVTAAPGQFAQYPGSGNLRYTPPPDASGLIVIDAALSISGPPPPNASTYTLSFTSRSDTVLYGVTFGTPVPQAGWTLHGDGTLGVSYPTDLDVLLTRELYPTSPVTFLDHNESWDIAYKASMHTEQSESLGVGFKELYFPFVGTGANPFFWRLFVKVHRTLYSERVKANRLRVLAAPYRDRGSSTDSVAGHEWQMRYSTAMIFHDVLVEAGVPPELISASDGVDVFTQQLAEGSVWAAARDLATVGSCIAQETADGHIIHKRHPQAPGAWHSMTPKLMLDGDGLWGPLRATARPNHAVNQVILECSNGMTGQSWLIAAPSDADGLGTTRTLPAMIVPSELAGESIARLTLRQLNGGWQLDAPTGPMALGLEYGDILPVRNLVDEAGQLFNQDFMVVGIQHSGRRQRMRSTIKLREWVTA